MTGTSRNSLHQGLGWYIHRSDDASAAAEYYGRVVQLPLLRGYGDAFLFWAGEARVFEPKSDAAPEMRWTDLQNLPTLPVFRTPELDALRQRLQSYGASITEPTSTEFGRQFLLSDPFGHVIGFRESHLDAGHPWDVRARALAKRAQPPSGFNPGCCPMPGDVQSLDWIVRRVSDLERATAFYSRTVGFGVLFHTGQSVLLDMGDNTVLELQPGGQSTSVPSDRFEVPGAPIIRVADFDAFTEQLDAQDVVYVNDRIQFGRGALGYFADPDGQILGYEERYEQKDFQNDTTAFPEDLEANRRWRDQEI